MVCRGQVTNDILPPPDDHRSDIPRNDMTQTGLSNLYRVLGKQPMVLWGIIILDNPHMHPL